MTNPQTEEARVAHAEPPYPSHASVGFELITPALAQRYLDTMHVNRVKSKLEVAVHEENLKSGHWFPEISPMYVDGGDRLAGDDRTWDAQHRLHAIVNTGISAYLLVVRGVGGEAAENIDVVRRRSHGDLLRMNNTVDYSAQAALTRSAVLYNMHGIEAIRNPGGYPAPLHERNKLVDTPEVLGSLHAGAALNRATRGATPSRISYAIWRTGSTDEAGNWSPDPFWESVRTGENLVKGDPALALRNWLMNGLRRSRKPADQRTMELYAYATAYNKHVTGQRYQTVQPVFDKRADGSTYFPAANVKDFLPRDIGEMTRNQVKTAYKNLSLTRGEKVRLRAPAGSRTLKDEQEEQ